MASSKESARRHGAGSRLAAAGAVLGVTVVAGVVFAYLQPDEWTSRATVRVTSSADAAQLQPGEGQVILRQRAKGFFGARHVLRPVIDDAVLYRELAQKGYDDRRLFGHLRDHSSYDVPGDDTVVLSYSHRDPTVAQAVCQRLAEVYVNPPTGSRDQTYRVTIAEPADRPTAPDGPDRGAVILTFAGAGLASSLGLVLFLFAFVRGGRPAVSEEQREDRDDEG